MKDTYKYPVPDKYDAAIQIQVNIDLESSEATLELKHKVEDRRMIITAAIVTKYGYTKGCEDCRYKREGLAETKVH